MPNHSIETSNPEPVSTPPSPQEPTPDAPIPPSTSEPVAMPPEVPESPTEAESAVPVNNNNDEIPLKPTIPQADPASNGTSKPEEIPESPTAQMAGNEPLAEPEFKSQIPTETYKNHTHENLTKAQLTIQEKKRKKLDKILEALNTKGKITNDEVEKLLHVSDATATRYLSILEKEGKIKQSGRTGQSVSYSRI